MATTSDLSKGAFLRYNGELIQVIDYTHITPGKGQAQYQVKGRNMLTGKQSEIRFRSGEKIDLVRVISKEMQYLYKEGEALMCMDNETFEQLPIPENLFGDSLKFLKENMNVTIQFDENDEAINAEPPTFVEMEITYTEPGIKGDTATKTLKPATVETGAEISVPLFVDMGEMVKIDTRTGEYVERVKN